MSEGCLQFTAAYIHFSFSVINSFLSLSKLQTLYRPLTYNVCRLLGILVWHFPSYRKASHFSIAPRLYSNLIQIGKVWVGLNYCRIGFVTIHLLLIYLYSRKHQFAAATELFTFSRTEPLHMS